jgi:3-hydroxymyristoyl/3-hydroxydecanoyl-(acyl carrier protein) dehydratase
MDIVSPEIVSESVDSNKAEFEIRIPASLLYLQGHFPGEPVLPGVVQVHWAIELARGKFDLKPDFAAIEGLKFHRVIEPETQIMLTIEFDEAAGKIRFAYTSGDDTYSQGRVLFE